MGTLLRDCRYALRTLARSPGFAAAAVTALALGIGGSSAIFSVLEGVVLRPLDAPHPDRLVRLYQTSPRHGFDSFTPGDYFDLEREGSALRSVAAVRDAGLTMTTEAGPVQVRGAKVTASFFAALGIDPAIGRGFLPADDRQGAPPEVVLTYGFWRRAFSSNPKIIGREVTLDGRPCTVAGVMPAGFRFPLVGEAEVLVPFAFEPKEHEQRSLSYLTVFGRLRDGLSLPQAQAELDVVGRRIAGRYAEHMESSIGAVPLLDDLVGPVKPILLALFGAVIMVLLIACANVAAMLLARGAARQRELAIRAALGSGRARIVSQLLVEALVLAVLGGIAGIFLAAWGVDALLALAPPSIPRLDEVRLDRTVVVFSVLVSVVSGVAAGLLPALQASRPALVDALKNGSSGAGSRSRMRQALVVGEVGLALVLAISSGLMIRTLRGLLEVPSGMTGTAQVLVADVDLPVEKYSSDHRIRSFHQELLSRVSTLPGVKSVALVDDVPLDPRRHWLLSFEIDGLPTPVPGQRPTAAVIWASPDLPRTLGIPLLRGRDLRASDTAKTPFVLLVNEAFAHKFFPGADALGRRIVRFSGDDDVWEIVGVIGDVRSNGLDRPAPPLIVVPYTQVPIAPTRILVRTAGAPLDFVPSLRREVQAIDKDQPVGHAHTLEQVVSESVTQQKFQMTLLTVFGAFALLLAALGVYGVMAYSVAQRVREIGIRLALGAEAGQVVRMVVGGGVRLALLGVALGLAGAAAVTRVLRAALFEVSATDPLTFATVSALVLAVAVAASWVPAWRASRLDPMIPLRAE
ncbi:MAG: ABC transporter permease [Myxococcales bacterium]